MYVSVLLVLFDVPTYWSVNQWKPLDACLSLTVKPATQTWYPQACLVFHHMFAFVSCSRKPLLVLICLGFCIICHACTQPFCMLTFLCCLTCVSFQSAVLVWSLYPVNLPTNQTIHSMSVITGLNFVLSSSLSSHFLSCVSFKSWLTSRLVHMSAFVCFAHLLALTLFTFYPKCMHVRHHMTVCVLVLIVISYFALLVCLTMFKFLSSLSITPIHVLYLTVNVAAILLVIACTGISSPSLNVWTSVLPAVLTSPLLPVTAWLLHHTCFTPPVSHYNCHLALCLHMLSQALVFLLCH